MNINTYVYFFSCIIVLFHWIPPLISLLFANYFNGWDPLINSIATCAIPQLLPCIILCNCASLTPFPLMRSAFQRDLSVLKYGTHSFISSRRIFATFINSAACSQHMLNNGWRRARELTGIPVRMHDIKHTFGRRLRSAGVSFEDRQDLLGHKSARITTHYSSAELLNLWKAANSVCEGRKTVSRTLLRQVQSVAHEKITKPMLEVLGEASN
jgi:hypothetical protein